jgi:hypothetical protein
MGSSSASIFHFLETGLVSWEPDRETATITNIEYITPMTITLPPELQAAIQSIADRRGADLNTIVLELIAQSLPKNSPEDLGYSQNFLDNVMGQWAGDPLQRPTQMPLQPIEETQWSIS